MNKKMISIAASFFILAGISQAQAKEKYLIDPKVSVVNCAVRRLSVSDVHGQFKDLKGEIYFDPKNIAKSSVNITIKTAGIATGNSFYDKVIRSRRLLDAGLYPEIIFKSKSVELKNGALFVRGSLSLHGVTKDIMFPFQLDEPILDRHQRKIIRARGQWVINRKDFNVIWNKLLDKAGLVVGNIVTIDWEVVGVKEKTAKKKASANPS
ncbi:MAG: polyisoprenoid-binding protein [Candidatus Omnitrophica bacterium]|nr:polyisoprenoid-binding protein [Candidatus Omnitrophota bacterium]